MRKLILVLVCILNTLPLNAQWIQQNVPSGIGIILSIDFQNSLMGCAGGWIDQSPFSGKILYSTNAGAIWNFGYVPDSTRAIVGLQYITGNTYYAAGAYNWSFPPTSKIPFAKNFPFSYMRKLENIGYTDAGSNTGGYFLKSTDNGLSWVPIGLIPSNITYITEMDFADANTGYMVGSQGNFDDQILKTTNGGINWSQQSLSVNARIESMDFPNVSTGFAAGFEFNGTDKGAIYRTTNEGNSWNRQIFPQVESFRDINFINPTTGFAIGLDTNIQLSVYKTINSGVNWVRLNQSFGTLVESSINFLPSTGRGMIVGSNYVKLLPDKIHIYYTSDYGNTWKKDSIAYDNPIIGVEMLNETNWYIGGGSISQAVIYHTTNGGNVFINPIGGTIPSDYHLEQNYPNPFNPSTIIKFSLPESTDVSLKVYDSLGREIKSLVNEKLSQGNYEVKFSGQGLNSGIYFYSLKADDFNVIRKMILIK